MNDVLIHTIIEHTKVMFYNFSITLKTCDMDTILCDMPIWKHVYHTLHSLDQCTSILKYILNRIFMNQI